MRKCREFHFIIYFKLKKNKHIKSHYRCGIIPSISDVRTYSPIYMGETGRLLSPCVNSILIQYNVKIKATCKKRVSKSKESTVYYIYSQNYCKDIISLLFSNKKYLKNGNNLSVIIELSKNILKR